MKSVTQEEAEAALGTLLCFMEQNPGSVIDRNYPEHWFDYSVVITQKSKNLQQSN